MERKVALITGGAKRLGREIALALAQRSWDIALHYSTSQADAQATAQEIRAAGAQCQLFKADLADRTQVRALIPQVIAAMPDLGLLVNNASVFDRASFLDTDEPLFDRAMALHVQAPYFLTQDFARLCSRGHIINLLDAKITHSSKAYFAYTLSKRALAELTLMAAKELAPAFRVNGVAPGPVLAPPGQDPASLQQLASLVPLGFVGNPSMISSAVIFLVESPYLTGQILYVDGGQHLA